MSRDQHGAAFGARAAGYAVSQVHVSDDSLEIIRGLLGSASSPSQWAIDLGTGAGFNAFNMAQLDYRTVATDPAGAMLREAGRIGCDRGLSNLALCQNIGGLPPLSSATLAIVCSRLDVHHIRCLLYASRAGRRE